MSQAILQQYCRGWRGHCRFWLEFRGHVLDPGRCLRWEFFENLVMLVVDIIQDCLSVTPALFQEAIEHETIPGGGRAILRLEVFQGFLFDIVDLSEKDRHTTLDGGQISHDSCAVFLDVVNDDPVWMSLVLPDSIRKTEPDSHGSVV